LANPSTTRATMNLRAPRLAAGTDAIDRARRGAGEAREAAERAQAAAARAELRTRETQEMCAGCGAPVEGGRVRYCLACLTYRGELAWARFSPRHREAAEAERALAGREPGTEG